MVRAIAGRANDRADRPGRGRGPGGRTIGRPMSFPASGPDRGHLLEDLNPSQREAVTHHGGPLLVVAGAGTGKTRVLTRRVAWLVEGGLPGRALLAITFTNKAAGVLRERLQALRAGADAWAGTFHAFAAHVLRVSGTAIGIDPEFTILDRDDQRRLLRDLIHDLAPGEPALKPAVVAEMISLGKNRGAGPRPLDLTSPSLEEAFDRVVRAYAARTRAANVLDFDDLLLEARRLLEEDEEAGDRYRRRFAHVLVDEYQDTNPVQAELLGALLSPARNLTVVGDPDQSIYRWRGAAVRNILEFDQDFPGARIVVLERNYRSTARILEAAEHVIAENVQRHAKRLYTEREPGAPLLEIGSPTAEHEADRIADLVERWRGEGFGYQDMAVFYRVNALSRAIEMAFRIRDIPYVVVAGVEFFQRREVKDLLAYARLVENPDDDAAFVRVVNAPRRGIGATSLARMRLAAAERGQSYTATLRAGGVNLPKRAREGVAALLGLIDAVRKMPRAPVHPILAALAERSGYRAALEADARQDDISTSRLANVEALVAHAHAYEKEAPEGDLRSFLERAALVADQDAYEEGGGRVSLMSVHAAKGLEFPCVVVAGAEDGYFPHARSETPVEREEERRLFYVAMTRAEERLAVTHAATRGTFRGSERRWPSPFLQAVPRRLREQRGMESYALFGDPEWGQRATDLPPDPGYPPEGDVVREGSFPFATGERVVHPYFGEGVLTDVLGSGPDVRVTVEFDEHGRKQMLFKHARLERPA